MEYYKSNFDEPYLQIIKEEGFPDPPEALWVNGKLPDCKPDRPKTVAIVGARRSTPYGENIAYSLAYDLAKCGVVVVSGLAYGIDACAHRGCLDAGGTTIAVLGTPIDQIYPSSNAYLARRILEKGAIVSEYDPGMEIKKYFFLQRNRIVTALADIVVIAEAAEKSGTIFTANVSQEQNKEVFAVPGNITRPMSAGCNRLISTGAHIYTGVDDILLALGLAGKEAGTGKYRNCSSAERLIIDSLKAGEKDMVELIADTKYSVSELMQVLTQLELKGLAKSTEKSTWILA